jgi:uncharacterized glyoxalase superfamily protein PhnB
MATLLNSRCVLAVRDLASATRFYIGILGFKRDFGDESDGWSFLSRDAFRVMLGHCADAMPATKLGDHSYYAYVIVDDVDAYYEEIVGRGAKVRTPPQNKPWGLREFALETPEGHRMTFGQPMS